MKRTIQNYIKSFETHQKAKYFREPFFVPLVTTETPSKPFKIVHEEVFYYSSITNLTIVDEFSKFSSAIPIDRKLQ